MKSAGIDIGSRTVKLVVLEDGKITHIRKGENSFDPLKVCAEFLQGVDYDVITATGYGRHLFSQHYPCEVISEIKAFASGARHLFPNCRTILDIGGQDTKAISLAVDGKLLKFEMNDKCAAGTGRFLEIMAMALGYSLTDFGQAACQAKRSEKISSLCTVFAESEVISLVAKGAVREDVSLGIHQGIVTRSIGMLQRVSIEDDVVFVGGVAYNPCMKNLLQEKLGRTVLIPEDPQIVGALGCALNGL
ncbi:MAG: acyl-CoA dehydratase activase [candidate division KSB1 bacterium]|nr:acyl-CoA dehydratase activase [candidate division KSB1 bacterium]MDZ7340317.1 acyl-CoA dehydratase activase [candidate division KSB1 bacterium]